MSDSELLDWLQHEQVDTIYMDDGRIIDVRSGDLRKAIEARRKKELDCQNLGGSLEYYT